MAKTSGEISVELQAKFEFYLLALTFSVLGLSIQTAEFGNYLSADAFELAGWLALFVSGVIGILRGEQIPVAYTIQWKITGIRQQRSGIAKDVRRGVQTPVSFVEGGKETVHIGAQAVEKFDTTIATLEQQFAAAEKKIIRRYYALRRSFMVGIGCLLIARGLPPTVLLAERIASWWSTLLSS